MKFRPDIEGLRALAIVPVVVFHAWPHALPGGFVGVDVFFVISGYLITTLLLQRLAAGKYSVASFYAARIRRIFPALFVMLALLAPACLWLLEPAALRDFGRQLGSTGLFVSNVELYRTTGYFESAADLKPLLHTWSLAVEEQYYILFPPLLALLWRFAPRSIGFVLLWIGGVSLIYCLREMPDAPEYAFFAAPTRVFELMIGSGLAWWVSRGCTPLSRPAWVDVWGGWCALLVLIACFWWMRAERAFPGPAALWPCLATAALIWVGSSPRAWSARLLSVAPLRWIGALSFSLYLWHWPLLVLMRHLVLGEPAFWQAGLTVALAVLLAWVSLHWIEAPVRRSVAGERLMLLVGGSALLLSVAAAWGVMAVADHRANQPGRDAVLRAGAEDISPDRKRCHLSGHMWLDYGAHCRFGPAGVTRSLVVWGDSHGVELSRALGDRVTDRRVIQVTGSSCPPAQDFEASEWSRCVEANRIQLERIVNDANVDTVLLAARYELYLNGPQSEAFVGGLARSVRRLREAGKQVLLLDPVPTYRYPVPAALAQRWRRGEDLELQGQTPAEYQFRQVAALSLVQKLATEYRAHRIPVGDLLCTQPRCLVLDGDHSLYFDDNHLSMHGAVKVAPAVLRLLQSSTANATEEVAR